MVVWLAFQYLAPAQKRIALHEYIVSLRSMVMGTASEICLNVAKRGKAQTLAETAGKEDSMAKDLISMAMAAQIRQTTDYAGYKTNI